MMIFWLGAYALQAKSPTVAYDMDMARDICKELPLDKMEGIWVYPEDKVAVMILRDDFSKNNPLPTYNISIVETNDARLHPGEVIGQMEATAQEGVYKIELSTERKNELLLKPKSCIVNLNKEGDAFIIKRQKAPFKGRLNFNFSRLLPGFWKIVSIGATQSGNDASLQAPVGMVKIYPSYDGNDSSRRKVRYL